MKSASERPLNDCDAWPAAARQEERHRAPEQMADGQIARLDADLPGARRLDEGEQSAPAKSMPPVAYWRITVSRLGRRKIAPMTPGPASLISGSGRRSAREGRPIRPRAQSKTAHRVVPRSGRRCRARPPATCRWTPCQGLPAGFGSVTLDDFRASHNQGRSSPPRTRRQPPNSPASSGTRIAVRMPFSPMARPEKVPARSLTARRLDPVAKSLRRNDSIRSDKALSWQRRVDLTGGMP